MVRLAIGLVLFCTWACTTITQANEKPNILWIVAEDLSAKDIGCYGNKAVDTPNLDSLAQSGMRFGQVYTTGAACSPSRTSMATGVFQTTLGAHHMRFSQELMPKLPQPVKILPEMMRENGYFTGNIKGVCDTGQGKDDWMFKTDQKKWDTHSWGELIRHQPFFAQIHFSESHRKFEKPSPKIRQNQMQIPPYYPDHPVTRNDWAGYLSSVSKVDNHVGNILKKLDSDGLSDNTIVVFISDHGRPFTRGKNWLYDSGTHIPMLIYYPEKVALPAKYRRGTTNTGLISAVDIVAETVLMGGGSVPDWMQGRSFLRKDSVSRHHVFSAVDRFGEVDTRSRAVRTNQYKYIRNYKTPASIVECATSYRKFNHPLYNLINVMGECNLLSPVQAQLLKPMVKEELYDLSQDPYETNNLAADSSHSETLREMQTTLNKWLRDSKDKGLGKDSPAIVKHFRDYGIQNDKRLGPSIAKNRTQIEALFE